jgi:hypothetical protein
VEHTTALNPAFNQALNSAGRLVGSSGNEPYALILRRLQQQATTLSYIDCFWSMGIVFGLLIPLVFLMRKTKPGRPAMAH